MELSQFLGERQTFLAEHQEEEKKENEPVNPTPGGNEQELCSFDILVYAYLKEELINNQDSAETQHLKQVKNLMGFVSYMDKYKHKKDLTLDKNLAEKRW